MIEPTETQTRVLSYIKARIAEGLPPTLQEISTAFGWKTHGAATNHLLALEKKGFIRRQANTNRGIFLQKAVA